MKNSFRSVCIGRFLRNDRKYSLLQFFVRDSGRHFLCISQDAEGRVMLFYAGSAGCRTTERTEALMDWTDESGIQYQRTSRCRKYKFQFASVIRGTLHSSPCLMLPVIYIFLPCTTKSHPETSLSRRTSVNKSTELLPLQLLCTKIVYVTCVFVFNYCTYIINNVYIYFPLFDKSILFKKFRKYSYISRFFISTK